MTPYVLRRLAQTIALLFVVITVVFLLIHLIPGDPALTVLGGAQANPDAVAVERVRASLGLDRPLHVQYLDYVGSVLRLDLGESFISQRPVAAEIMERLPRTVMIIVPAMFLAIALGIPLGLLGARLRESIWDPVIAGFVLLGFSVPSFVLAVLFGLVFSAELGWLPFGGFSSPWEDPLGFATRAILPIVAIAALPLAVVTRTMRSSVLEQLGQDYVRTARAKGLSERAVLYGHVVRNALLPVVTVVGLTFGQMFAGSVLIEFVFNWPGVNTLLLQSVEQRDYPVVQGIVLVVAAIFVITNLLTDLSYGKLDPRIGHA